MTQPRKPDEPTHPGDIGLLSTHTVMPKSECPTHRGQKGGNSHAYSVTVRTQSEGTKKTQTVRPSNRPNDPPRRRSLHQRLPMPRTQHRHIPRDLTDQPRVRKQNHERRAGHEPRELRERLRPEITAALPRPGLGIKQYHSADPGAMPRGGRSPIDPGAMPRGGRSPIDPGAPPRGQPNPTRANC